MTGAVGNYVNPNGVLQIIMDHNNGRLLTLNGRRFAGKYGFLIKPGIFKGWIAFGYRLQNPSIGDNGASAREEHQS